MESSSVVTQGSFWSASHSSPPGASSTRSWRTPFTAWKKLSILMTSPFFKRITRLSPFRPMDWMLSGAAAIFTTQGCASDNRFLPLTSVTCPELFAIS